MATNSAGPKSKGIPAQVKKLTFLSIFLLGINGIVGSGTFLLPQQIYANAGFIWGLVVIFAAGVATILIAFCYADLSGKFTGEGGAWLYSYTAWGGFAGFEVGFFMWFSGVVAISAEMAALIRVFKNIIPAFKHDWIAILAGVCAIVILGLINWFGLNIVKWINNISSGIKIAAAVFFVVVGVFFLKAANFEPLVPEAVEKGGHLFGNISATYAIVFYMFTGFSFLPIAARRMNNPRKNLPRALITIMLAVTVIYMTVQIVAVGILGPDIVNSSIPVAHAMQKIMGDWGYYIIIVGSAVSIFGVAFASSFDVPIIASSLADEHKLLPAFFGKQNRFGAPFISIILTVIVSSLLLLTGDYVFLATCLVCANFVQYIPTILGVIKLRKMPSAPGALSLKGPWVWIVAVLAFISACYVLVGFNWEVIIVAVVVFVVALIIYFIDRAYRKKHGITVDSPTALTPAVAASVPVGHTQAPPLPGEAKPTVAPPLPGEAKGASGASGSTTNPDAPAPPLP